MFVSEVMKTVS